MTVNQRFFSDLLTDRQLSLRQLAKRMDILPSQLSLTFNGKRRMQMGEAVRIAQILGAPLTDVMSAAGIEGVSRSYCKVAGIMGGDGLIVPVDGAVVERVMLPEGMPEECNAIQARTADSPLSWLDGWIFFCNSKHPPEEFTGRFCWVKIQDGPELLATIRRGYSAGTFNLSGPVTMTSQRLEWAKPVLVTKH